MPVIIPADDLSEVVRIRHELHTVPCLSNEELPTATTLLSHFRRMEKAAGQTGVHVEYLERLAETAGFAVVLKPSGSSEQEKDIATTLRCELDALPLKETAAWRPYASKNEGVAHKCGHDGHMAILLLVFRRVLLAPDTFLKAGRIVLLFQPAEETGDGAVAIVRDDRFLRAARGDDAIALALHNVPGMPEGMARVRTGTLSCASRGIEIFIEGAHAHAAYPDTGISPLPALQELLLQLQAMQARQAALRAATCDEPAAKRAALSTAPFPTATVTYVRVGGEPNFGISPGEAVVQGTIRAESDEEMEVLRAELEAHVKALSSERVPVSLKYHEVFPATVNTPESRDLLHRAATLSNVPCDDLPDPMRWAEDFGAVIKAVGKGAMFILGGGDRPALHTYEYDFNDKTIDSGARVFLQALALRHAAE